MPIYYMTILSSVKLKNGTVLGNVLCRGCIRTALADEPRPDRVGPDGEQTNVIPGPWRTTVNTTRDNESETVQSVSLLDVERTVAIGVRRENVDLVVPWQCNLLLAEPLDIDEVDHESFSSICWELLECYAGTYWIE